jgi:uncharacterized hydrophobic protein (TIGR00271 family)
MLRLRLSLPKDRADRAGDELGTIDGVSRVSVLASLDGEAVIVADVENPASEAVAERVGALGVSDHDYVITRLDVVAPDPFEHSRAPGEATVGWLELLGRARSNSRPLARYLALMAIAGLVAALGVVKDNSILIVGAMAVSPDLLPISAAAVGFVSRRLRLVRRALGTLAIGLGLTAVVSAAVTFLLDAFGYLEENFDISAHGLDGLTHTDYSTVLIALAAGVAAMLTFETRASAAVGVAISVTTIPASTYWGVALGAGQADDANGALVVLVVNVALLLFAATTTLATQQWLTHRGAAADATVG